MLSDYYMLLDLPDGSSVEEIKRAYRKKAREYHPDLNHSANAMDTFIRLTEAYEFLITNFNRSKINDASFEKANEEWYKYKRDISRRRAEAYARASYIQFKNTRFYKTTRILDGTTIIFSLVIAIGVTSFAIYGYIWKIRNPVASEKPPLFSFILLLSLGVFFLAVSLAFLKAYFLSSRWYKSRHKD
jgi:hypothetical protein